MKDYRLDFKVKNNYLLTAMRENGYFMVARLAEDSGLSASTLCQYLNLGTTALTKMGNIREPLQRLAVFLKRTPDQLFPPQHFEAPLKSNKGSIEVSFDDVARLMHEDLTSLSAVLPDAGLEAEDLRQMLGEALKHLTPREKRVLELRFGLNGEDELTLEETANRIVEEGVWPYRTDRERIRQIEAKAIRKLRHPSRGRDLRALAYSYKESAE